ncbi:Alpha-N-acetylgalactosaminidase [Polystyrenella longa]|uniref:Alpha-N-acetylgalactosaminidase n=1 Tax=Polystyrenella longa TaxID=2528007 RepID=A0A518CHD9_9PLAN|nr:Gfo/Idh/MocA family oxidoreductase [Polystyrenella longa]QDU78643.1 Alpha-N-acetylgalactosaminidase [Polystyrenella longa]
MTKQSRREFLENSMFATAAAYAASSALSQPLMAANKQEKGPNEKYAVAVVGVKGRGQSHISGFTGSPDSEVVALVDPDEKYLNQRADEIAKKTGKRPAVYTDLRKCYEDQAIDIVSIATPNHWHALAAIWAVQAGKHVYVEKPVSHNVSEGRRIVDAARKHGKIVQTGTQSRSMKGTLDVMDFMHQGGVGTISKARGLCYKRRKSIGPKGNYDVPETVDYDLWTGPAPMEELTRPQFHYDWHWQFLYGNGDLGNQGIHQMDLARWGLGVSGIGDSVLSYGGRLGYEDAGDVANTQVSVHNYGDKQLIFEVRGLETELYMDTRVGVIYYGSEGYVVQPSYSSAVAYDLDGQVTEKFTGGGNHFQNFIDAVRANDHTILNADIEEGHYSSALCHLGNISYRLGEKMTVAEVGEKLGDNDEYQETLGRFTQHLKNNGLEGESTEISLGPTLKLEGEEFTGEMAEQASPMLTREYRKGFEVPSAENV